MKFDVLDGERIIRKSVATLFRENKRHDGELCLSNMRLQFKGIDKEYWSYSLDEIVSVKLKTIWFFREAGISLEFKDGRKETISVYGGADWIMRILKAKSSVGAFQAREIKLEDNVLYMSREKIRQNLTNYFNESELQALCFNLNIDFDDIPGNNKEAKARELIIYCERAGKLQELLLRCKELRSNADWS